MSQKRDYLSELGVPSFDLRGALRIGEALSRRRYEKAAAEGKPFSMPLEPMVIDEEQSMVARAITALVALENVPVAVACAAARTALLAQGWWSGEDPQLYVCRMRRAIRGELRVRLSLVPSPPVNLEERRREALVSICVHRPLGEIEPANDIESERANG